MIYEQLGEGGMGVVYRAFDRHRTATVALKRMRELSPAALARFKQEFRAIADLHHPNIVSLFDLVFEDGDWGVTMEVVDGVDLLTWVRGEQPGDLAPAAPTKTAVGTPAPDRTEALAPKRPISATLAWRHGRPDISRVRSTAAQLADALDALERAGLVHRDLKPSNVMVTREGRAVLMDFGIVAQVQRDPGAALDRGVVGTPRWMAPEQLRGEPATPASDRYALGGLLYACLAGRPPFVGAEHAVIAAKLSIEPQRLGSIVDHVPHDLDELTSRLLAISPHDRPSIEEVLAVLRPQRAASWPRRALADWTSPAFVGRVQELASVHGALSRARAGGSALVQVVGPPGMGKTAFVRRFLADVERGGLARTFAGRCHERETVPFKAFDMLVDELAGHIARVGHEVRQQLLPFCEPLFATFPVLEQFAGEPPADRSAGGDGRPAAALRQLLENLSKRHPIVIAIDDMQWCDRDSAELLQELLAVELPGVLTILAGRDVGDVEHRLPRVMHRVALARRDVEILHLEPLDQAARRELLRAVSGRQISRSFEDALDQSGGTPLLVLELARCLAEGDASTGPARLETLIAARVRRLPSASKALLEAVALAELPTQVPVLVEAAALASSEAQLALAPLRAGRFVVSGPSGDVQALSVAHDLVREAVLLPMEAPRRRDLHAALAHALERAGAPPSHEMAARVGRHWLAAGHGTRALPHLTAAARAAASRRAYEHAADLLREALTCEGADRMDLESQMGDALDRAGRYYEAAQAFRRAAAHSAPAQRVDFERRTAENLWRSGRMEEGLAVLRSATRAMSIATAETRIGAIANVVWQQGMLAVRRVVKARVPAATHPRRLVELDTLFHLATSFAMVDHLRGAAVQALHLRRALSAGDERRLCRARALEVGYRSVLLGAREDEAARRVLVDARRLADPDLIGLAQLGLGMRALFGTRLDAAKPLLAAAEATLARGVDVGYYRETARMLRATAFTTSGDLREAVPLIVTELARAERRRDVYLTNVYRAEPSVHVAIVRDDIDAAYRSLAAALDGHPAGAVTMAQYQVLLGRALAQLYEQDGAAAGATLDALERIMRALLLNHAPFGMAEVHLYRGRAAILVGDTSRVRREAKRLGRYPGLALARGGRGVLTAWLALRRRDATRAASLLSAASQDFEAGGMHQYALACRCRRGQLVGGDAARVAEQAFVAWASGQGVRAPARFLTFLVPGFA